MIYFIQCGENGPVKIGYTDGDVQARLAQLQTGCPYRLRLLWVYDGQDYTEQEIHYRFEGERVRGEWFHFSESLYNFINEDLVNSYKIDTPNGRQITIDECFDAIDQISFRTNKKGSKGQTKFTNLYHNHQTGNLRISPADNNTKIYVLGRFAH